MARNMQPIAKRCKALNLSPAAMGYSKKNTNRNPKGQMRKKQSEYAMQLNEKQKVKFVYGMQEKQFRMYYEKAAYEEAEHAAKFAELLGEVLTDSTKKNLELRIAAENGATEGKAMLAKRAKELNLDAIHDTVHEMARDEARHGKAFEALHKRYFA